MSLKSPKSKMPTINETQLKELFFEGNLFDSTHNQQLINIVQQIQQGNRKLYKQYLGIVTQTLKIPNLRKQHKQLVFDHITQLTITANPSLINDLNNDLFPLIPIVYKQTDAQFLSQHISLWKFMYNGTKQRDDYPNVAKTLQKIKTSSSGQIQLNNKLSKYLNLFNKNIQKIHQKKVQFFEDFQDSSMSQSFQDQSRMSQIVYMDVMEIKAIRQKVQKQQLKQQNCQQYLIKMKTFLNLKTNSLSGQLLTQFTKEKLWAKHFIDHHQEYLNRTNNPTNNSLNYLQGVNNSLGYGNSNTNELIISLSKDQQSLDQPPANFYKNKQGNKFQNTLTKQQTFGYGQRQTDKKKLQSEIRNFTINDVPIDQSRFTQKDIEGVPVWNNEGSKNDGIKQNGSRISESELNKNKKVVHGPFNIIDPSKYQRMSFTPVHNRQTVTKPVKISRPHPQDTLPLEESTLQNMSIPQQVITTQQLKATPHKSTGSYNDYGFDTSSKNPGFSSSNNPFANSKTNYNPIESKFNYNNQNKSPYDYYKKDQQFNIDATSPIRNRMTQNDLDSDGVDQNVVIKTYNNKNHPDNRQVFQQGHPANLGYGQTQDNWRASNKNNNQQLGYNFLSQQKIMSQQLSPRDNNRSQQFSSSKNKKRLSQLTSQKKIRKNNTVKTQVMNQPEEYVHRPYSVHFRRGNSQGFSNFKRNCLQDHFTVYASQQLVIQCTLKKINDSKVQVSIKYQNQLKSPLQMKVLYKIPKCFKIEKVTKVHKKFSLRMAQSHMFNLTVIQFPLEMCFLDLTYFQSQDEQQTGVQNLSIPLSVTIKNFIQVLTSSKQEWLSTYQKLVGKITPSKTPFMISKTFELNRQVIDPSMIDYVLTKQFINVGGIEGYSVEEFGCTCYYKNLNNLLFLVRISIRVDHIMTVQILSQSETSFNERDFMKYYLEVLVTLMGSYAF